MSGSGGASARRRRVAPPRGERGLKYQQPAPQTVWPSGRSPSWGAWIEILVAGVCSFAVFSRSPSWGAWIEIRRGVVISAETICRSPSWGAWIEICWTCGHCRTWPVAPPRGERGLKYAVTHKFSALLLSRSPSWGAWIEMLDALVFHWLYVVAPPRGERGLKYFFSAPLKRCGLSLPLVGSVD